MTFTDELWQAAAPVLEAIDKLPFLIALEDGSLPRDHFDYYMAQDAHYLASYGRVLASAAGPTIPMTCCSGREAPPPRSASNGSCMQYTCRTSLRWTGRRRAPPTRRTCSPVLVAGLLSCFWIYEDVGRRLKDRIGGLVGHPYADWIDTYGDSGFAAVTGQARVIVDRAAEQAGRADRERMRRTFATAARYEWMFWDAAWRRETWPV